jgi:uncharacterized protein YhfF
MEINSLIQNFWFEFCKSLNKIEKINLCMEIIPDCWSFGDNPQMADDLLLYVLSGEKTATSGMVLDYENDNEPIPKVGDKSIILNGNNEPKCIIEVVSVEIKKFKDVDEEFALKEGEGFKSLDDWRKVHWDFFTRRCEVLGISLNEEIVLVCEEFKLIFKK